jgi:hypothetical protein
VSTFSAPAIGRAYLAGIKDVMQMELDIVMLATFSLAILLAFV